MTDVELPHFHEGSGATLVVVPGLSGRAGSPSFLRRWMRHKEVAHFIHDRVVYSIDRGYDLTPGTTIADMAAKYAETIESLFDGPVDVMGISTGGSIALQLAADFPHLVRRLVLVSSAHRLSDHGRRVQRRVAALLREGRDRRAAAVFLGNTGAKRFDQALRYAAGLVAPRAIVGHGDHDLLVTLDAEDNLDLDDRLPTIHVRTLIAGGQYDGFYSSALFEHASKKMPNATVSVYANAGHLGTQGNPRLAREILGFLEAA